MKWDAEAASSPPSDSEEKRKSGCRVLLVDDEKSITTLYAMILASELPECKVDCAANGREAINLFMEHWHSVVLLDLHMPVLDGQTTFREIENLCRQYQRPMPSVVFCTGFAPPGFVRKLVNSDPRHCLLMKPVENDELVAAVKQRLSLAGGGQACN